MRKKELVHLHALLAITLEVTMENRDIPETTLAGYPEEYPEPSAVHRAKDHHEDAVQILARALAEELPKHRAEPPVAE